MPEYRKFKGDMIDTNYTGVEICQLKYLLDQFFTDCNRYQLEENGTSIRYMETEHSLRWFDNVSN